jgi:hypothetical protein
VIVGAVMLIVVGALLYNFAQKKQVEASVASAYSGPLYAPSTSPRSPLPGFELTSFDVPLTSDGDGEIDLLYVRPASDALGRSSYTLNYGSSFDSWECGNFDPGSDSACESIGSVLGAPVVIEPSTHTYLVFVDGGVIALQGNFGDAEALTVLNDLRPASVGDFLALKTSAVG